MIIKKFNREFIMNTICNDPYLYTIDNFLTDKECNFIINASKENLKMAGVSMMDGEKNFEPGKYKGRTKRLKKSKKNQLNTLPEITAPVTNNIIGKISR